MKTFFCVLAFISIQLMSVFSQPKFQLGVNIDSQSGGAFVNVAQHTHRYSKATGYDSLGYPTSDFELLILDSRPAQEWSNSIDDPERYRVDVSGRYDCSFRGRATVAAPWVSASVENMIYDPTGNTSYFTLVVGGYPNANHGLVNLVFTNTRRSEADAINSGITELRVNRPGYPVGGTKVFTDEFLTLLKSADFACYRFYGVQNVWECEPIYPARTTWSQRKKPNYSCQIAVPSLGTNDGWSWEYIVALAKILRKDIWICLPISADTNYVKSVARMLKDSLDPSINIYVENSNEVWGPTFMAYGKYNQADAVSRGITFNQNYARRTVELSNLFADVFGKEEINRRIRVVLGSQQFYSGRSDEHLNYIKNIFGEPKNFIYALNPSIYFGSKTAGASLPIAIANGMIGDIDDMINNSAHAAYRDNHFRRGRDWGLVGGCVSYEGGVGIPSGGDTMYLGNQILANRTAEVARAIQRNYIEGWKDLGGGLACYFTLASSYNRYGCWGLTDDFTKPDRNHKMQAMREIIGGASSAVEPTPNDGQSLTFSPNPSNGEITITAKSHSIVQSLTVNDQLGRTVYTYTPEYALNTVHLSLDSQPSGIYQIVSRVDGRLFFHSLQLFK